jgi:uncharacterized protein
MKKKLLELIVCPKCRSVLERDAKAGELICQNCGLGYPLREGIPVLIEAEARKTAPPRTDT